MASFRLTWVVFFAILFLFPAQEIFADGGGYKPEDKKRVEASAAKDSMYSTKEANPLLGSDDSFDNMFSPADLFTQDELDSPDSMLMDDKKMEGGHNERTEHQEAQVQLSHHEQVSLSSKGFGTAVGITLFVGLVFAGLTFMRLGE